MSLKLLTLHSFTHWTYLLTCPLPRPLSPGTESTLVKNHSVLSVVCPLMVLHDSRVGTSIVSNVLFFFFNYRVRNRQVLCPPWCTRDPGLQAHEQSQRGSVPHSGRMGKCLAALCFNCRMCTPGRVRRDFSAAHKVYCSWNTVFVFKVIFTLFTLWREGWVRQSLPTRLFIVHCQCHRVYYSEIWRCLLI